MVGLTTFGQDGMSIIAKTGCKNAVDAHLVTTGGGIGTPGGGLGTPGGGSPTPGGAGPLPADATLSKRLQNAASTMTDDPHTSISRACLANGPREICASQKATRLGKPRDYGNRVIGQDGLHQLNNRLFQPAISTMPMI